MEFGWRQKATDRALPYYTRPALWKLFPNWNIVAMPAHASTQPANICQNRYWKKKGKRKKATIFTVDFLTYKFKVLEFKLVERLKMLFIGLLTFWLPLPLSTHRIPEKLITFALVLGIYQSKKSSITKKKIRTTPSDVLLIFNFFTIYTREMRGMESEAGGFKSPNKPSNSSNVKHMF